MKIKRVYTVHAIMSQDHVYTFDSSKNMIEEVSGGVLINKTTLIPHSNIRELIVEKEEYIPLATLPDVGINAPELPEIKTKKVKNAK